MSKKIKYYEYIRSEAWQRKRRQFYSSNMFKCFKGEGKWNCYCCGISNVPLDLHHRTYKRLGKEKINIDLVPVCRTCHDEIHLLIETRNFHVWGATKSVRKRKVKAKKDA
jgi:hypothetical protein